MKTAEEILKEHSVEQISDSGRVRVWYHNIVNAMNEYASQFHSTDRVMEEIGKAFDAGREDGRTDALWDAGKISRHECEGKADKETYLNNRKKELEK